MLSFHFPPSGKNTYLSGLCVSFKICNFPHICYVCSWLLSLWLFETPWTVACQAPLSMGILRILEWVSLLQVIFPTQGSNPGLPHCRRILYRLSHREAKTYNSSLKIRKTPNSNKEISYKTSQNYQGHQKIQEMSEKLKAKKILRRHDN